MDKHIIERLGAELFGNNLHHNLIDELPSYRFSNEGDTIYFSEMAFCQGIDLRDADLVSLLLFTKDGYVCSYSTPKHLLEDKESLLKDIYETLEKEKKIKCNSKTS
ncbi:MAG: hypothetical protein GY861_05435 [bacterium]|nr:hypothetical protein [bacterium]